MKVKERLILMNIIKLRREQRELMYGCYIKPFDDSLSLIRKALKQEISIEELRHRTELLNKHIKIDIF